jgi:hypothetical protein
MNSLAVDDFVVVHRTLAPFEFNGVQ